MRCAACGSRVEKDEVFSGDEGTLYEGKPVCESCYCENEPAATVYYNRNEQPLVISGTKNETSGDFRVKWHATDPWRGYYETCSDAYSLVNSAELLAYHASERMLKEFDTRIKDLFDEYGIEYARVFSKTSNVFYQNYDLYVRKDQVLPAVLLVTKVKSEVNYDDPKWDRNIVFNENTLRRLADLFPERKVETDFNAVELIKELHEGGQNALDDLKRRMQEKEERK